MSMLRTLAAALEHLVGLAARALADAPSTTASSDLHDLGLEPPRALDGEEWVSRVVLPPH